MKIAMLESIAVSEELLRALAKPIEDLGHSIELCTSAISDDEKARRIKDADAIIIANSPLPEGLVESAEQLKMISVAFTGVDHVPKSVCINRNVTVCNAQGYATTAVRDLVFGMIFACLRNLVPCDKVTRAGGTKDGLVGEELEGKTLGIIGYGAIGQSVAKAAKAFDCHVLAYSRKAIPGSEDGIVQYASFEDIITKSDIISMHVPLTEDTRDMIGAAELAKMKPSAILINAARGDVVNAAALRDALNQGVIRSAGIDVFTIEPPLESTEPMLWAKNTVLAPHIGFATKESMVKRAKIVFENITAWLDGKPQNVKF